MAQVQGEEIYLAHSGQEVDDNIDEVQAARGSEASLSARLAAIVGDFETDQQRQETEIGVVAAMGAKNLFPITAISQTLGGVTFTVNDDGTITANGTKTNNDWFILSENNSFDANTYTLSDGLPNDTTDCQLIITTARSMGAAIMATAVNSRPQTKTFTTAQTGLYYAIRIASGKTVNNLTFKPMIRRAEITDGTYAPYAPTNRELYEAKANKGTFDLTIAGSPLVASEYSYSCIVTGDIVTICIRLVLGDELAVNTSRNLFKIPADYRPPVTCAGTGYANSKLCTFWVNTSGDIKIRIDEAIPSGSSINANFCYSYKSTNWQTVTPASLQSAPASLMQAGRIDAELTDAGTDESEEEER